MTEPAPVTVTVELSPAQALALAQLVKRFGFTHAEDLSVDRSEAETMIAAVIELQKALDDAGYSPR